MKKIFLLAFLFVLCFTPLVLADRNTATVTAYYTSQLIQRGEGKIYSISFVATANAGDFIIYDAITPTSSADGSDLSEIKAEGSEVTTAGSQYQDFSDKPLEFGTGIYLVVNDGYVIISYE